MKFLHTFVVTEYFIVILENPQLSGLQFSNLTCSSINGKYMFQNNDHTSTLKPGYYFLIHPFNYALYIYIYIYIMHILE